nr:copia protein [Tanacetum cinerariifolium]
DLPYGKRAIGTKWVYKNKKDERGIVIRNKPRLVAQGHTQEEGIDYEEAFAPVARIKAIRLFLAYASFMGFLVYQMDVKSVFLYGTIEEEVYQSVEDRKNLSEKKKEEEDEHLRFLSHRKYPTDVALRIRDEDTDEFSLDFVKSRERFDSFPGFNRRVVKSPGSESRPPMLNKENYVPWSSRLLRYAKSRPNEKLIHSSILNGPHVRRMIPEPGDAERDVNVNETFHEQT